MSLLYIKKEQNFIENVNIEYTYRCTYKFKDTEIDNQRIWAFSIRDKVIINKTLEMMRVFVLTFNQTLLNRDYHNCEEI